ncbi:MAG: hypothetical protein L0H53_13680 [Candidatus Nitrosocosmicus sp.]|nr:hypothetical protein [Candidatus Nitrosocosmicus sp.]
MTKKEFKILSLLLSVCLLLNMITLSNDNYVLQIAYGHNFAPNDYASFVSNVDQFETEAHLVKTNLANDNLSLAQEHANEAFSIFYWDLMVEIAEQDKKISDELKAAAERLQNITLSFPNAGSLLSLSKTNDTTDNSQEQLIQQASRLITTIDTNTDIVINLTETRKQAEESSFFNQVVGFFSSIFTGQQQQDNNNNGSIHPMRFAELIDNVLRNYGDAYNVNFDMTDMTNMATMMNDGSFGDDADDDNSNQNTDTNRMNMSSTMMYTDHNTHGTSSLVNVEDYQSAQGLASKSLDVFYNHLKPMMSKNETSVYSNNLEKGLIQLNNSIKEKVSPMNIMMIVHTKIHPNFIEAFDIQLLQ